MPPAKRGNAEASRILFVRNLPFKATGEDLYKIFGRYGLIRQVRIGNTKTTKGSAFVVYYDVTDAKSAMDALTGFHVDQRYLVVLYFHPSRKKIATDLEKKRQEVEDLRAEYERMEQQRKNLS
jgi:pre-mRNA branch site protein p14